MAWMWPHAWLLISNTVLGRPANWLVGWSDTISSSALLFERRDERTPIQMEQAVPGTACPVLLCVYWLRAFHGTSTELVHRLCGGLTDLTDYEYYTSGPSTFETGVPLMHGDANKTQESFKATINKLKLASLVLMNRKWFSKNEKVESIISRSSSRQHPRLLVCIKEVFGVLLRAPPTASWLSTWDSIPIDKHRRWRDNKPWNSW